jgi:glutamate-1-semialdehyde 2,1-aminomutase
VNNPRYQKSTEFLLRAERSIPLGSQTFSKSRIQYPVGNAPLFIDRGKGTFVWDIDGNKYIDLVNGLASVTIGYCNKSIDSNVKKQMKMGTIFTLPGILEAEVAELIIQTVPSAEMVRFAKNGSDATTAAIRLARAYTNRNEIAICGYHSWQDWYIGTTSMNKGVPESVKNLSHTFIYNDISSLESIFKTYPNKVAAIIMEPMTSVYPKNNFLQKVKHVAEKNGAILIFDETITGYRYSKGGAQYEFGINPDLTTLGKGIANGYPLSALTGKKEIMKELDKVFFSGTFGGELLSLAAAKSVIEMHIKSNITDEISRIGSKVSTELEKIVANCNMTKFLKIDGHPTWKFLQWNGNNEFDSLALKTYFMQEMLKEGVLILSTHNNSLSLNERIANKLMDKYGSVLDKMSKTIYNGSILSKLESKPLTPLFSTR